MSGPVVYGPLRVVAGKEAVNQSAGKTIAADPVVNLQVAAIGHLVKLAVVPGQGFPVVDRRGFKEA
jgi:hypothetical protein